MGRCHFFVIVREVLLCQFHRKPLRHLILQSIRTKQTFILSNIKVGLFADDNAGVVSWSLSADQYNKTESHDNPSNGTLYLNLLNEAGAVIPSSSGKKIAMFPAHSHCREQGTQVWQGKAYGYPTGGRPARYDQKRVAGLRNNYL